MFLNKIISNLFLLRCLASSDENIIISKLSTENVNQITSIVFDDESNNITKIFECKNLEKLCFSNCFIESIPKEIRNLKKLKEIYILCQNLKYIDSEMLSHQYLDTFTLKKSLLKSLNFKINPGTAIIKPNKLIVFNNLKTLVISENKLLNEISFVKSDLNLKKKKLKIFPNIEKLILSSNGLTFIPSELKEMKNLDCFDCSNNKIDDTNDLFGGCILLRMVNLSENKFKFISSSILKLKNIEMIDISNNPVSPYNESSEVNSKIGWIELYEHFGTRVHISDQKRRFQCAKLILNQENKNESFYWNFRLVSKVRFNHKNIDDDIRSVQILAKYVIKKMDSEYSCVLEKYLEIFDSPVTSKNNYLIKKYLMRELSYFLDKAIYMIESNRINDVQKHIEYLGTYIETYNESPILTLTSICQSIYLSVIDRKTLEIFGSEIYHVFKDENELSIRDQVISFVYKSIFLFKNECLREIVFDSNSDSDNEFNIENKHINDNDTYKILKDSKIPLKEFYKYCIFEYIGFDTMSDSFSDQDLEKSPDILKKFLSKFTLDNFLKNLMKECNNTSRISDLLECFLKLFYDGKKVSEMFSSTNGNSDEKLKIKKEGLLKILSILNIIKNKKSNTFSNLRDYIVSNNNKSK